MNGTIGRIINALGLISVVVVALQAGGAIALMPPKVAALVAVVGATASALSERLQGGASTVNVEQARANETAGTAK